MAGTCLGRLLSTVSRSLERSYLNLGTSLVMETLSLPRFSFSITSLSLSSLYLAGVLKKGVLKNIEGVSMNCSFLAYSPRAATKHCVDLPDAYSL